MSTLSSTQDSSLRSDRPRRAARWRGSFAASLVALVAALVITLLALLTSASHASAAAAPYPPTVTCSASPAPASSAPAGATTRTGGVACGEIRGISTHRRAASGHVARTRTHPDSDSGLAFTGFRVLTAGVLAALLLGIGALLLLAGRRRRS